MLLLSEDDVRDLLHMGECIDALESAFKALAHGRARTEPRHRLRTPNAMLHVLSAALLDENVYGFKYYTTTRSGARFRVELFDLDNGRPLARIQANRLGQVRTGAASGLATRHLAQADASVLALLGTGFQAETQVEAVAAVRKLAEVRCYSRNSARRDSFVRKMKERTGLPIRACNFPEETVKGAHIVCTATSSRVPVFPGTALGPGTHVNAVGSNSLDRREVDDETLKRATRIFLDSRSQAPLECGDLLPAVERGRLAWEEIPELADLVGGRVPTRQPSDDVTLFESQGMGLEDVAAAFLVYGKAKAAGRGREFED